MQGNSRYVEGNLTHRDRVHAGRRAELAAGQAPFATVLGCADSRTSPAHIFDAGLGELFVCRNAGNLVDEVTLGSIEYAASHTGCTLLMVMGHNRCGAAGAAVAAARDPGAFESHNIDDIVRRMLPAVLATRREGAGDPEWIDATARQNVLLVARQVVQRSSLLQDMVEAGDFMIASGFYDLETGRVELLASDPP